ncbi:MAG: transposase, partial [Bacteroidales bacterium]|nr:transposase [Bacteroidales bacterium]
MSNDRIVNIDDNNVTFTWKDYKNNYAKQTTILPGEEFLRLFCMHILPPGFTRIRHYGILSSASKKKSLAIIRTSLNATPPCVATKKPWQEIAFERMGIIPGVCNCCGGKMVIVETIPNRFGHRTRAPPVEKTYKSLENHLATILAPIKC